jgi:phosphatidylglycerol:prolipoprotein diacylglycerol transferase
MPLHDGPVSSPAAGVIHIGIDPVVRLGPAAIHWYGVMYAIAFWVGYRVAVVPWLSRHGVDRPTIDRMITWTIVMGLIGARLYYVAQSGVGYYLTHPQHILAVWEGGMAFFGAILASFATLAVLAWRHHVSFWILADAGVLFAVVGQPIGRIGNIINGDILGGLSTLPWATAYTSPDAILQPGFYRCIPDAFECPAYQPAAAYEALGTIVIGLILLALVRRGVRDGMLAISYVTLYAVSQLIIFHWRESEPAIVAGLRQAQLTSMVVLAVGVPLLLVLWRRTRPRAPDAPGAGTGEAPMTAEVAAPPEPEPATRPADSRAGG